MTCPFKNGQEILDFPFNARNEGKTFIVLAVFSLRYSSENQETNECPFRIGQEILDYPFNARNEGKISIVLAVFCL